MVRVGFACCSKVSKGGLGSLGDGGWQVVDIPSVTPGRVRQGWGFDV